MIFFNEQNILSARFIDNQKKDIEVLYKGPNDSIITHIVGVDSEQEDFIELLKIFTIDEIENNTKKWIQDQNEAFLEFNKRLIESGKISVDATFTNGDVYYKKDIVETLFFFDETKESHKERLFEFKLHLFDLEKIQNASDEIKDSIRQSKSPIDLILIVKNVVDN